MEKSRSAMKSSQETSRCLALGMIALLFAAVSERCEGQQSVSPAITADTAAQLTSGLSVHLTGGAVSTGGNNALNAASVNLSAQPAVVWTPVVTAFDARVQNPSVGGALQRPLSGTGGISAWQATRQATLAGTQLPNSQAVYSRIPAQTWGEGVGSDAGDGADQASVGAAALGSGALLPASSCLDSPAACATLAAPLISPVLGPPSVPSGPTMRRSASARSRPIRRPPAHSQTPTSSSPAGESSSNLGPRKPGSPNHLQY